MIRTERTLRLYWFTVVVYGVLLAWWVYFFWREGDFLVARIAERGIELSPEQTEAVHSATRGTLRMFVFEGGFIGILLLAGVFLVVRSLRREIQVNHQQRNFLSAVTHELRSPIASARLYLESIALGRAEGEKRERYLRHAQEDLERLGRLVEEVLAVTRLEAGRAQLEEDDVDLGALVSERVGGIQGSPAAGDATIDVSVAGTVHVLADPGAIEKIVDNLVSNACKYGGTDPRVEVSVFALDGYGVLDVRDHGPGLNGTDPDHIFDAFVRGGDEDVRHQPGVGLGLYLVSQLARAQGGRASAVDGLPGGGSRFRVELPLEAAG